MRSRAVFPVPFVASTVLLSLLGPPSLAQMPLPPDDRRPFDAQLRLLDFTNPTTIQGRIRLVDRAEKTIWLDWERRLLQDSSGTRWHELDGDWMLLVYPKDADQFQALGGMPVGTRLQLVIQTNEKGQRLILSYGDPSLPPERSL